MLVLRSPFHYLRAPEQAALFVRKRDGVRQPFDRAKLRAGLARAAHKRPVSGADIDAIVDRIESEAERSGGELPAQANRRDLPRGAAAARPDLLPPVRLRNSSTEAVRAELASHA